ncbi:ABC transporter G family member [Zostera marina]|uniref:ABC transporter G family member n=1 Tax=Zostera marina TaxID=29655 RepID=A0A0K9NKZ9_ZOSMR|nr:ABC transporter G family member [Zostera marina]
MEYSGDVSKFNDKPKRPITIMFEDVVFKIKNKETWKRKKKNQSETKRTILNKVSGIVKPGEMLAVLGPSGSGKTTLITALGARLLSGNLSGTITYNNKPFNSSIKRSIGFVTQQDVHHPFLTVSETLRYTALLRLPDTLSRKEKVAFADEFIVSLGLEKCRESVVGGGRIRGVSGGERKRLSIGQELLVKPSLLFLDEPTSGLDSTTAQKIMCMLCDLTRNGRTVLMTIHQPSTRIFYMFDKMMLLADGNPMYFGKGSDAMTYFHSIGYTPTMDINPSDYLLDLANGVSSEYSNGSSSTVVSSDSTALKSCLFSAYRTTNEPSLMTEIKDHKLSLTDIRVDRTVDDDGWSTSWWEQFVALFWRGLKEKRCETLSTTKIIRITVMTILIGLIWFRSHNSVQDQSGLLFYVTMFWAFNKLGDTLMTFPLERQILEKERISSMYHLSSYMAAFAAEEIVVELILPILSVTVVYWLGGLRPTAAAYLETIFSVLLCTLVSLGFGLAIGSQVMDMEHAGLLSSVLLSTMMLFGGFFGRKTPAFMKWVRYVSFIYHSYRLNMIAQFSMRSPEDLGPNVEAQMEITKGSWSWSFIALLVMVFGFRFIAYLGLRRLGVPIKSK